MKGVEKNLFAEGKDVVTCRVALKRAPKGIAPVDGEAWLFF